MRGNLGLALTTVAVLLLAGAAMPPPIWLFPPRTSTIPRPAVPHALAGSTLHPTDDQLETMADAVDWYPGDHPAAPNAVLHGSGKASACGYCHLPNGAGRPENASLAGLDAAYIRRAVHAYAGGTRDSSDPAFRAFQLMKQTAIAADDADVDAAAAYFSQLPRHAFGRVIETASIPSPVGDAMVYRPDPSGRREVLGQRLIEMPDDLGGSKRAILALAIPPMCRPARLPKARTLRPGWRPADHPRAPRAMGGTTTARPLPRRWPADRPRTSRGNWSITAAARVTMTRPPRCKRSPRI